MLLPVIERFAELGWQAFVEPGETYELFSVSGIFKRSHVDTAAGDGAQVIAQRNALFDVCLSSGLAHLIVAYVRAREPVARAVHLPQDGARTGKHYVLKEPVAVQQWLQGHIDSLEKTIHSDVEALSHVREAAAPSSASLPADHHHHNRMHRKGHKIGDATTLQSHVRELSGLHAVALALLERLKESAHQFEENACELRALPSHGASARPEELLQQTELARLTYEGIHNLLEVLFRVQSASLKCQCVQWLKESHISFDPDQYHEFYYQARSARASLRQSFEGSYDVVLSSVSNSDITFPSLLIELVMQNANVAETIPPNTLGDLFKLLQSPVVHEDMVKLYAAEVSHEPVEAFFRIQTALLLYFALDLAYVTMSQSPSHKQHLWAGAELVDRFVDVADSFAAQMGVPDNMKATLLAIWLIENAVNVRLASNEEVGPIYQGAVTRLLESSALHLQRKASLEPELILYMVETLVHRGESSFAWKIWTAFDMELNQLPPVATEYAVMVNLELSAWERALSILRQQRRLDLLQLVFKWLVKNNRAKELVHHATLTRDEEQVFDNFMMGGRFLGDDVLLDISIRKADMLVMYYVLRNQFAKAWAVHHEHLALIRQSTSGNTNVAQAVLHQPSFRIRAALLQNMKAEPSATNDAQYNFQRSFRPTRPVDTDVVMIGSGVFPLMQLPEMSASEDEERMSDDIPLMASAPTSSVQSASLLSTPQREGVPNGEGSSSGNPSQSQASFTYSPGIYSSRSSLPRTASSIATPSSATESTPAAPIRSVPIGSIDSSPGTARPPRRHSLDSSSKRVAQVLNFGLSPVVPHGAESSGVTPTSAGGVQSSERPHALVLQPVRSAFSSAFSSLSSKQTIPADDLALRPRVEAAVESSPSGVQAGKSNGVVTMADHGQSSSIAAVASTASQDVAMFSTPKRFHFVREPPKTDSRAVGKPQELSPATQELEAMELEPIDEEFSTPAARASRGLARKEPQSVPTRRNPRRNSRTLY